MRLAIVASHPIQYQAPIFRALAGRDDVELRVHFGSVPDRRAQGEGFGVEFEWDVPLLEGYLWDVFAEGLGSMADLPAMWAASRFLHRTWTKDRPDVVLHSGWHRACMFPALAVALGMRIPCMLRCEANLQTSRGATKLLWHRWVLARYAAFLPTGRGNAAYFDALGPADTPRFFSPLFSGGEAMRLEAERWRSKRPLLRRQWGLDETAFCFLFAGKFIAKKRPCDFLRAVARTADRGVKCQALLVGSGAEEDALHQIARETGVKAGFAGFLNQSEMPRAYAAADCLVLPSDAGEVWGLVVNEAMACGLPAIVSDQVGCAGDLVEPGATGMVFPCGDVEALADCMVRMVVDSAAASRMGARAQERVAGYSAERAAEGILDGAREVMRRMAL